MKSFALIALLSCSAAGLGQSADQKQLNSLTKSLSVAELAYTKSPKSKAAKHNLVIATDKLATATMTSEALSPRLRYPEALGLYQQALKLDPTNSEAKNNAAMIDSVYRTMIARAKSKLKSTPSDSSASVDLARLRAIYQKIHRPLP